MTEILLDTRSDYGWRPVFNRTIELAEVAEDARATLEQMAHLSQVVARMNVGDLEAADIIEALQLCERSYGYARIAIALEFVTAVVESSIVLTGTTITRIAQQRSYRSAGLLVGCLVEERIGVEHATRHFPKTDFETRLGSPYVEYEDCLSGASIAEHLRLLKESDVSAVKPLSALTFAFRRSLGKKGLQYLEETAASAGTLMSPLEAFAGAVRAEAVRTGIRLPAQWQRFGRKRP